MIRALSKLWNFDFGIKVTFLAKYFFWAITTWKSVRHELPNNLWGVWKMTGENFHFFFINESLILCFYTDRELISPMRQLFCGVVIHSLACFRRNQRAWKMDGKSAVFCPALTFGSWSNFISEWASKDGQSFRGCEKILPRIWTQTNGRDGVLN